MALNVIPNPYPDQILDVTWPLVSTTAAVAAVFEVNGNPRYGIATAYGVWGAVFGTGPATNNMLIHKGAYAGQFTCDGAGNYSGRAMNGFSVQLNLDKPVGAPPRMTFPEQTRCYGLTFLMAVRTLRNYSAKTGVVMQLAAGAVPGWIDAGNAGFGIVGDGAGGWQFVSKKAAGAGVYDEQVPIVWPLARTEWARVDYVLLGATSTGAAAFQLWVDNLLILERSWAAGTLLPDYTAASAPANAARMIPLAQCGELAVSGELAIAGLRYQAGRFHPVTGTEVGS